VDRWNFYARYQSGFLRVSTHLVSRAGPSTRLGHDMNLAMFFARGGAPAIPASAHRSVPCRRLCMVNTARAQFSPSVSVGHT